MDQLRRSAEVEPTAQSAHTNLSQRQCRLLPAGVPMMSQLDVCPDARLLERRRGGDRRSAFRGGRRAIDFARTALTAGVLTVVIVSPVSAQSRQPRDTSVMTG